MEGCFVALGIQFHTPKVVVGKRVAGRKRNGAFQRLAGRPELMFGPSEKSEVAIGIFEQRIEAIRFLIFGGSLGIFAHPDEQDPAKVTNTRVIGVFTFRAAELYQGILKPILFERGEAPLKCIPRRSNLIGGFTGRRGANRNYTRTKTENENREGVHVIFVSSSSQRSSADLVTSPKRSVFFSSLSWDSRFRAVDRANSCAAFAFSPRA